MATRAAAGMAAPSGYGGTAAFEASAIDAMARTAAVVAEATSPRSAARDLNAVLGPSAGLAISEVVILSPAMRRATEAAAPDDIDRAVIDAWTTGTPQPVQVGRTWRIPLVRRRRVYGLLRLTSTVPVPSPPHPALLAAVASGWSEVLAKASLRQRVADAGRRLAAVSERERIVRDVNDSVGQHVTSIGMQVAAHLATTREEVWRRRLEDLLRMSGEAGRDVREATYSLVFLEARRAGLEPSLRSLVSRFQATTGTRCVLNVSGDGTALTEERQEVLFRVAHAALLNIQRHARAAHVSVNLAVEDGGAVLAVRDDGVGITHRDPFGVTGNGLISIRDRVRSEGGRVRLAAAQPRGVVVEATLPPRPARKSRMAR